MAHPSQNRPSTDMRIQIPTDDAVVKRFLDGQSPRARSAVMRQLIHIFVAEHGDKDVFSVAGSLLAAKPGERSVPETISVDEAYTVPVSDEAEVTAEAEPDTEVDAETDEDEVVAESAAPTSQAQLAKKHEPTDDGDSDQTPDISEMFA